MPFSVLRGPLHVTGLAACKMRMLRKVAPVSHWLSKVEFDEIVPLGFVGVPLG